MPRSEFHQNLIVEYSSGTALAALEPLLPSIYITEDEDNKYHLRYLASIYIENVRNRKTQLYLADLKLLAKVTGKHYTEVLKDMMSQISESIAELEPASPNGKESAEETPGLRILKTSPQPSFKASPTFTHTFFFLTVSFP